MAWLTPRRPGRSALPAGYPVILSSARSAQREVEGSSHRASANTQAQPYFGSEYVMILGIKNAALGGFNPWVLACTRACKSRASQVLKGPKWCLQTPSEHFQVSVEGD